MRQTILQAAMKIQTLNTKLLMTNTLHMTQKREIQEGSPERNWMTIRDLGLPKNGAEYIASALKEKGNLEKGTKFILEIFSFWLRTV